MAQAFKPQDVHVFSTALPMISRGFCIFLRSESRFKVVLTYARRTVRDRCAFRQHPIVCAPYGLQIRHW
ncbi:hypothetical protein Metme_3223 [Methylomonas methanica MC09]|uniref:Uncharacterized protein n=1 Tax=Methylomonas methanica (strain DSM 25384 / MC09) TaxID=857087 RepID=G0A4K6_METMM|nr:hypothetical protein Metme_3223 [Methylomonas methanica MC09]